jgi:ankyrin repeat protein
MVLASGAAALFIVVGAIGWFFMSADRERKNERPRREEQGEEKESGRLSLSNEDRALFQAVRENDADEVSRLLLAGARVDAVDDLGSTPIKAAISLNRADAARRILEIEGGSLPSDNSLLVYAIVQNRAEIVRELLKRVAPGSLDRLDKNGLTPLMYAVTRNHATVTRDLLEAGANVDEPDKYGRTPLMTAANSGKPDMIAILLQAGADVSLPSPEGDTALDIARRKNRNVAISILTRAY